MVRCSSKRATEWWVESSVPSQTNMYVCRSRPKISDYCHAHWCDAPEICSWSRGGSWFHGTQTYTQSVWPCKLPIYTLRLHHLALLPVLMSDMSKQPPRYFPSTVIEWKFDIVINVFIIKDSPQTNQPWPWHLACQVGFRKVTPRWALCTQCHWVDCICE